MFGAHDQLAAAIPDYTGRIGARAARGSEAGAMMIQLIIVLVIIGLLGAIVANPVRSARESGQRRSSIEAGRTIAEAIDRFRLDHGGRPPQLGSTDWPAANTGPVNGLTGKRYLQTTPDFLADGSVVLQATISMQPWSLVYRATTAAPHGFRLDVIYRGSASQPSCAIVLDAAPPAVLSGLARC